LTAGWNHIPIIRASRGLRATGITHLLSAVCDRALFSQGQEKRAVIDRTYSVRQLQ